MFSAHATVSSQRAFFSTSLLRFHPLRIKGTGDSAGLQTLVSPYAASRLDTEYQAFGSGQTFIIVVTVNRLVALSPYRPNKSRFLHNPGSKLEIHGIQQVVERSHGRGSPTREGFSVKRSIRGL